MITMHQRPDEAARTKDKSCRLEQKHKGATAEMIAIVWLLENGYEVFRNVSAHGAVDIIATRGTEALFLDVKGSRTGARTNKEQIVRGVKFLVVDIESKECRIIDPPEPKIKHNCKQCGRKIYRPDAHKVFCSGICQSRFKTHSKTINRVEAVSQALPCAIAF